MISTWANGLMSSGGGPVELWPQPAFDASTGLTLTNAVIAGGTLTLQSTGSPANCVTSSALPITLVNGMTLHYEVVITSSDLDSAGDILRLQIGGTSIPISTSDGPQTLTGQIVTAASTQTIGLMTAAGDGTVVITSCSVTKV